jgi:hypothetical protein
MLPFPGHFQDRLPLLSYIITFFTEKIQSGPSHSHEALSLSGMLYLWDFVYFVDSFGVIIEDIYESIDKYAKRKSSVDF